MEKEKLTLGEMISLAERVDSWKYFPRREGDFFCSTIPEHYIGEVKKIQLEVGQTVATPWGGWLRYISVSYDGLELGKYPRGLEQDQELNRLFFHEIPFKIQKRGWSSVKNILKNEREN